MMRKLILTKTKPNHNRKGTPLTILFNTSESFALMTLCEIRNDAQNATVITLPGLGKAVVFQSVKEILAAIENSDSSKGDINLDEPIRERWKQEDTKQFQRRLIEGTSYDHS
jgi:hypothetical protein